MTARHCIRNRSCKTRMSHSSRTCGSRTSTSEVATQPLRSHETCSMEKTLDAANRRIQDIQQKQPTTSLTRGAGLPRSSLLG